MFLFFIFEIDISSYEQKEITDNHQVYHHIYGSQCKCGNKTKNNRGVFNKALFSESTFKGSNCPL